MIGKFRNLKKSNLKAPKVNEPEIQRAIEKVYDDLNKLIDGVNNTKGSVTEEYDGEPGDIRLVKAQKGVYTLEAKGDEGWVTAVLNGIPIAYTAIGSRSREVGADQDFTGAQGTTGATGPQGAQGPQGPPGATGAQGEAGFRDADWTSPWTPITYDSTYTIDHNLGLTDVPNSMMYWVSEGQGTYPIYGPFWNLHSSGVNVFLISENTLQIETENSYIAGDGGAGSGSPDGYEFRTGYIKLMLWR
tara:strand:+ start:10633 stop:11367 length:735 start_codon:yes stop_codon:yes gene_type:complete